LDDTLRRADLRAAPTVPTASGWISLRSVALAHDVAVDNVESDGSHAKSIVAVQHGRCHVASIDAVSWAHLAPRACTSSGMDHAFPACRWSRRDRRAWRCATNCGVASSSAVLDPSLAEACATLKIRRFMERDLADYRSVTQLLEVS
jgi:hypothetical protein